MKLHTSSEHIERVGVQTENTFTIKSTAKSFEILSAALYSDPITAIIRELSCNAYDSHVAADKISTPFLIHLPNNLEPFLSVRDFGIGLSDDDVRHLYTTYFESTKTDSNDFIGALGLGSKSPFGYTKSYEIISRFDGTERSYHSFINEDGIPDIVRMNEIPTTECNGLEVKLGVNKDDFRKFQSATAKVLRHFSVQPEIVGVVSFAFEKVPKPALSGDNWFTHTEPSYQHFTAVQGNIEYKTNLSMLKDMFSKQEWNIINSLNIIYYFDLGQIELAPSREEVRYNEQSKIAIVNAIKSVLCSISKTVLSKLDLNTSFWDFNINLSELSRSMFNQYNNRLVSQLLSLDAPNNGAHISRIQNNPDSIDISSLQNLVCHRVSHYEYKSTNICQTSKSTLPTSVTPNHKIAVVLNDVPRGGILRLKSFLANDETIYTAIVITDIDRELTIEEQDKFTNYPQAEYESIIKTLGNPQVLKVSDHCPKLLPAERNTTLNAFKYKSTEWYERGQRVVWDKHECDITTGGLYFVLKSGHHITARYGTAEESPVTWKVSDVKSHITYLVDLANEYFDTDQYTADNIIGVSVPTYKKIKNDPKWINVVDLLLDITPDVIHTYKKINARLIATTDTQNVINAVRDEKKCDIIKTLPSTSPFIKTISELMIDLEQLKHNESRLKFYTDTVHQVYPSQKLPTNVKPYFYSKAFDRYNMLSVLPSGLPTNLVHLQKVVDYIRLVDNNNKRNIRKERMK